MTVEALSVQEFKQKVFQILSTAGYPQKLKAQLRSQIIAEIQSHAASPLPHKPLLRKAIDSLIVEYLQSQGNDFTLSVFLPESGLGSLSHVCSLKLLLFETV